MLKNQNTLHISKSMFLKWLWQSSWMESSKDFPNSTIEKKKIVAFITTNVNKKKCF